MQILERRPRDTQGTLDSCEIGMAFLPSNCRTLVQVCVLRLISEEIPDEYNEVLARHRVRRELIGTIINLLREEATLVEVYVLQRVLPDPGMISPALACRRV
jgi:hypothetical protein